MSYTVSNRRARPPALRHRRVWFNVTAAVSGDATAAAGVVAVTVTRNTPLGGAGGTVTAIAEPTVTVRTPGAGGGATPSPVQPVVTTLALAASTGGTTQALSRTVTVLAPLGSAGGTITNIATPVITVLQPSATGGAAVIPAPVTPTVTTLTPLGGAGGTTTSLTITVTTLQAQGVTPDATANAGVVTATVSALTPGGGVTVTPAPVQAVVTGPGSGAAPTHPTSSASNMSSTSPSCAITIGSGAGRIVIVEVAGEVGTNPVTYTTPTFNGVTMTLAVEFNQGLGTGGSANDRIGIYYLLDASLPAAGSYTATFTFTGSPPSHGHISAHYFEGIAQAVPEATAGDGVTGATSPYVSNITTLSPNALVVDAIIGSTGSRSWTENAGTELVDDTNAGATTGVQWRTPATAGASSINWTPNSNDHLRTAHVVAAWAPLAVGVPLTGDAGGVPAPAQPVVSVLQASATGGGTPDATANAGVVSVTATVFAPAGGVSALPGVVAVITPFGGLTYADDFNRADSASLGGDWAESGAGDLQVVSNTVQNAAASLTARGAYLYDAQTDDVYVQVDTVRINTNGGCIPILMARLDSLGTTNYEGRITGSGGGPTTYTCDLRRRIVGFGTVIIAGPVNVTRATADTMQVLRVECQGSTIRLKVDGVTMLTVTDTTIPTGRRGGIAIFANVQADTVIDNFQVGDLLVPSMVLATGGAGGTTGTLTIPVNVRQPSASGASDATANAGVVSATVTVRTPAGGAGGSASQPPITTTLPTLGGGSSTSPATVGVGVFLQTLAVGAGGTTSALARTVTALTPAVGAGGTTIAPVARQVTVLAPAPGVAGIPAPVQPTVTRLTPLGGAGGTTTSLQVTVTVLTTVAGGNAIAGPGPVVVTATTNTPTGGAGGTTQTQPHAVTVLQPGASGSATASPAPVSVAVTVRTPAGGAGGTTTTLPISVTVLGLPSAGGATAGVVGVGVSTLTLIGGAGGSASQPASTATLPQPGGGSSGTTVVLAAGVGVQSPAGGAGGTTTALACTVTVLTPSAAGTSVAQAGLVAATVTVRTPAGGAGGVADPVAATVTVLMAALFTGVFPGGVLVGVGAGPGVATDVNGRAGVTVTTSAGAGVLVGEDGGGSSTGARRAGGVAVGVS